MVSLVACSGSSGGGTSPSTPAAGGSITLTGTVSGTVIKVLNATSNAVLAQTDTASLPGPPPFSFTLANISIGVPIKIFFFNAGQTFPLYIGNTNVFTVLTTGSIDLGFVTLGSGRAIPANQPLENTIQPGTEDSSPPPPDMLPSTASISVTNPNNGAQVQGSDVTVTNKRGDEPDSGSR